MTIRKLLICFMSCMGFVNTNKPLTLTSNVTTVTEGEIYNLNCTSIYHKVSFFRNDKNFTTIEKSVGEPCDTSKKDATCKVTRNGSSGPFLHELFVKATGKQGGNTTWNCTHYSSHSTGSNTVSLIIITENDNNPNVGTEGLNSVLYGIIGTSFLLCVSVVSLVVCLTIRHRRRISRERKKPEQIIIVNENVLYDCPPVDGDLLCPPAIEVLQDTSSFDNRVYSVVDKEEIKGISTFNDNLTPDCINEGEQSVTYAEVQRKV